MKKFIVVLVSSITAVAVSGQTGNLGSNTEVYRTIMRSKEANHSNGIFDPNKIQIGDHLTFKFSDGFDTIYYVSKGDNQWKIVSKMLATMPKVHGSLVNYSDTLKPVRIEEPLPVSPINARYNPWYMPDWLVAVLWTIIGLAACSIIYWFSKNRKKDPATSGPAMRPGGLTRDTVHASMRDSAARQFQNPNIRIVRIEEGTLNSNGHAIAIDYADRSRKRVLLNEPGFRATVLVGDNPTPQFVYTLMRCGNDVRMGHGLNSPFITFTPLTTNSEVPAPVAATPELPVVVEEKANEVDAMMTFDDLVKGLPNIITAVNASNNGIQIIYKTSGVNLTCTIRSAHDAQDEDKKEDKKK